MNIAQELYRKKTDSMATSATTPHSKLTLQMSSSSAKKKEIISPCDMKGSPATLAKLMTKYEEKAKKIEKLKRQLRETKEEEIEAKEKEARQPGGKHASQTKL